MINSIANQWHKSIAYRHQSSINNRTMTAHQSARKINHGKMHPDVSGIPKSSALLTEQVDASSIPAINRYDGELVS